MNNYSSDSTDGLEPNPDTAGATRPDQPDQPDQHDQQGATGGDEPWQTPGTQAQAQSATRPTEGQDQAQPSVQPQAPAPAQSQLQPQPQTQTQTQPQAQDHAQRQAQPEAQASKPTHLWKKPSARGRGKGADKPQLQSPYESPYDGPSSAYSLGGGIGDQGFGYSAPPQVPDQPWPSQDQSQVQGQGDAQPTQQPQPAYGTQPAQPAQPAYTAQPAQSGYGTQQSQQDPYQQPGYGDPAAQQYGQYQPYAQRYQPQGNAAPSGYVSYSPASNERWNTLCILGFVLTFILPPVGLVFSCIALSQINRTGEQNKGLSIAGIVIGTLGTLGTILLATLLIAGLTANNSDSDWDDDDCYYGESCSSKQTDFVGDHGVEAYLNRVLTETATRCSDQ
ncbi:DUF4190 domain-containing protein [Bifidobacterium sp. ESL0763]|uniref:DUF4190 domain-containing protein n=1 Tax=Bifidobacterium sp. ESL0763 TaxID=2983227 RepID=UPI0023F6A358|nr:DUF4190 domain-containing protein [Bifidobacterium sp. ESL0763]MDF7663517.1 DUF4190 domain-containing protein [Bifidobacterium sp. ESL0763]